MTSGLLALPRRRPYRVRDSFTRADSALTLGSADLGGAWTAVAGTFGVSSNQGYSASDANQDVCTIDPRIGDAELLATVSGDVDNVGSNLRYYDVMFRFTDTSNYLRVHVLAGFVALQKVVAGAVTQLAAVAQTSTDGVGYRLRIRYTGAYVTVAVDGVPRLSVTLSGGEMATFPSSATRVGLLLQKANAPSVAARFDGLEVRRL